MNQLIFPKSLQRIVKKPAHHLGHLGMTKVDANRKVLVPVHEQYDRSLVSVMSAGNRQEPIKVTDIPMKCRDVIAVDFSGPYLDSHHNLVARDKKITYPEAAKTDSTVFQPAMEKLKTMLAIHGTPRQLESDKGPLFN